MYIISHTEPIDIPKGVSYVCFQAGSRWYYGLNTTKYVPSDAIRVPLHVGIRIAGRDDVRWVHPSTSTEGLESITNMRKMFLQKTAVGG